MGPEQRRHWVRIVLAHRELTAAAKTVLLALETFANYEDGTNAHPGEERLAEMVGGLGLRAVQLAMKRGRDLGLIVRTAPANPKAHLAAVWRLTFPPTEDGSTGTDVRVEDIYTRTVVQVETPSTRTDVRVETANTRTTDRQYPNAHDGSTRTSVRTTLHAPSLKHPPVVEISGGRGTQVGASDPRPHCPEHDENSDEPCRKCERRRKWDDAHPGWRERDELERKRRIREIATNCPVCHGTHWIPDTNPAVRCTHELQEAKRG